MWQQLILPRLGSMKVDAVRHADIDALHAEISIARPVRANRAAEVIRKAFNLAIRWGWRTDNPASGVHRNHEERRTRYLSPAEILRLSEALAGHPEKASVNAIRLLMRPALAAARCWARAGTCLTSTSAYGSSHPATPSSGRNTACRYRRRQSSC